MLLPRPLRAPFDETYKDYLYAGASPEALFGGPVGEASLAPPGGVSWRVFANPVPLFVGGVLAVILELALPGVRAGVWDHSTFRLDPRHRLQRTGLAAMMTVYGAKSAALEMIEGVNRQHRGVRGTLPDGTPYAATDERLLTWVGATALFGFGRAYEVLIAPLGASWDDLFTEGLPAASAYGAMGAPTERAGWDALLGATATDLEPSEVVATFLRLMTRTPVLPAIARPLQAPLVRIAASLVPDQAAHVLPGGVAARPGDLALGRAAAGAALRLLPPSAPPLLACERLGLDPSVLSPRQAG